ncbi:hypothetical protein WJX81_006494 [Elliptochloris bilobata]|uniref:3-ketoacyl-CoA synthase n=1 Tax=Elliptochloris bilobata TaxID=381761 RepID=A0AAW1SIU3_9CHLO
MGVRALLEERYNLDTCAWLLLSAALAVPASLWGYAGAAASAPALWPCAFARPSDCWQLHSWSSGALLACALWAGVVAAAARRVVTRRRTGVYLLNFACFSPAPELRVTREETVDILRSTLVPQGMTEETLGHIRAQLFNDRLIGLGDATAVPPGLRRAPADQSLAAALEELELATFGAVADALKTSGVQAQEVDFLISACSSLVLMPSLAAMVANRFGMRRDTATYALGGQCCAAGVITVDLARRLMQTRPESVALVVVCEPITLGMAANNDLDFLGNLSLMRTGAAAVLLTNRRRDRARAKYELLHTTRVLLPHDAAFGAIQWRQDGEGVAGLRFRARAIVAAASTAVRANLTVLAPLVLPLSELVFTLLHKGYVPNFASAFDSVLIHTGAAVVIDKIVAELGLPPSAAAPSRETLHRFGNLSPASTFYVLACKESSQAGVRRGERILQLSFGAGFKGAAAVWRAVRDIHCAHPAWARRV